MNNGYLNETSNFLLHDNIIGLYVIFVIWYICVFFMLFTGGFKTKYSFYISLIPFLPFIKFIIKQIIKIGK